MSRLFHSLVVCGAGLTLVSCGGRYDSNGKQAEPSEGGSATAEGGSQASPAGTAPMLELGGNTSTAGGGAGAVATGGFATSGAGPGPLLPGGEGQWVCQEEITGCTEVRYDTAIIQGFELGESCAVDPTRPKSANDCVPGQRFSCSVGFFYGTSLLFNCECTVREGGDCGRCPFTRQGCWSSSGDQRCDEQQTVCGCAMTCILK